MYQQDPKPQQPTMTTIVQVVPDKPREEIGMVDVAAGQLAVRERGYVIANADGGEFGEAPLDLVPRSRIAAAGTDELCATLIAGLSG